MPLNTADLLLVSGKLTNLRDLFRIYMETFVEVDEVKMLYNAKSRYTEHRNVAAMIEDALRSYVSELNTVTNQIESDVAHFCATPISDYNAKHGIGA